ncbi:MAG: inositol monophosphatase [Alphaproteobacteria bacterium]|nr:inositol monophosphatase [Alphaproteobacteria bacterium]
MSYISTNLNLLMTIVKKAGTGISRDFSEIEQLQTSIKGHKEFTKAAVDRTTSILTAELKKARPQYAVVAQGGKAPNANYFLISALDGDVNFMHGIPYFAINIAEVVNGNIVSAVIYNPATSDMYFAEKGNGAFKEGFRNHERLRVSARKDLNTALVSSTEEKIKNDVSAVRSFGAVSLDLAYLASGKLDGLISFGNDAATIAAGVLLVREAGGQVFAKGQKDIRDADLGLVLAEGNVVASNAELGKKLFNLI